MTNKVRKLALCLSFRSIHRPVVTLFNIVVLLIVPVRAAQRVGVSQGFQVSTTNASLSHSEVLIAADPLNSKHLLACSMLEPQPLSMETARTVAYVSFDGGTTWLST